MVYLWWKIQCCLSTCINLNTQKPQSVVLWCVRDLTVFLRLIGNLRSQFVCRNVRFNQNYWPVMAEIFVWHLLSLLIYHFLHRALFLRVDSPSLCSTATPTGPKSSSVSLRAVWWRTTRSGHRRSSCWSTPSSETSPTRGKSAFSSKTTLTAPRRKGERRVRVSLFLHLSPGCFASLFYLLTPKTWQGLLVLISTCIYCADETEYEYSGSEEEEEDPPEQEGEPRYGAVQTY